MYNITSHLTFFISVLFFFKLSIPGTTPPLDPKNLLKAVSVGAKIVKDP
jgi:hypothetical protein